MAKHVECLLTEKRYKKLCLFLFETTAMYYDKYGRVVQTFVLTDI